MRSRAPPGTCLRPLLAAVTVHEVLLASPRPQISKYHGILTDNEPIAAGQRLRSLPVHLDDEQSQCVSFERVKILDSVSVHVALTR